jgi:hypothetical protein
MHWKWVLALGATAAAALVGPAVANAAVVDNGDFETGNLSGWTLDNSPDDMSAGSWFAYTGTTPPISGMFPGSAPVSPPPQGNFAAITDQGGPGRRILYQDITVPSAGPQYLTLFVYYSTAVDLASPDSLDPAGPFENEQYRIDVMRPTAALDSVAPADVLKTVFRTQTGAPHVLAPTKTIVELASLMGQTVRLRFAEVDNSGVLNAGTDAVSVDSDLITLGTPRANKKKGTALLPVSVPFPGTLSLSGNGVAQQSTAPASKAVAVQAGTTSLLVKATGKKKRKLKRKGKTNVSLTVTYTPTGTTTPGSETTNVKLKKKRKKK